MMKQLHHRLFIALALCLSIDAFSVSPSQAKTSSTFKSSTDTNNILILDHLNINHQKGRHDLVKAFYFDFLQCAIDPRKASNLEKGSKTLWANIGAHQFHLPEGKPNAQVLEGVITLSYPNVNDLVDAYNNNSDLIDKLKESCFSMVQISDTELEVTDPWGTKFQIHSHGEGIGKDDRGVQKGESSTGLSLSDLTIYTPPKTNLEGIGRFYNQVLGADLLSNHNEKCTVCMGPYQTLTFIHHPDHNVETVNHTDLREEHLDDDAELANRPLYPSNYGPHISLYVSNIRDTYRKVVDLGVAYVNPRFKRRAYTEEEVVSDCMFRCLDIVDPENVEAGVIFQLEHEVRSVLTRDGDLYKSCPFDCVPKQCRI